MTNYEDSEYQDVQNDSIESHTRNFNVANESLTATDIKKKKNRNEKSKLRKFQLKSIIIWRTRVFINDVWSVLFLYLEVSKI